MCVSVCSVLKCVRVWVMVGVNICERVKECVSVCGWVNVSVCVCVSMCECVSVGMTVCMSENECVFDCVQVCMSV